MNYRHLLIAVVGLACLPAVMTGQAKKVDWFLVLKVDGKDVKLEVRGAWFDAVEEGADTFVLSGVPVDLTGDVDVNGDGKLDGKDKLAVDDEGEVKPASGLNKKVFLEPTEEDDELALQNHVDLPGHGPCAVLKGSTLTVTKFRKAGESDYIFSGTADLKLKTKKGKQLNVQGRWEAGTGEG